jgi:voltage-gated potassium channel
LSDFDPDTWVTRLNLIDNSNFEVNINLKKNYILSFYWCLTTITTVGYGDRFPTTTEGRFLAVGLMIMGISLMGVITASVASWFVKMGQSESTK